jgi:hypothetical protein
MRDDRIHTMTRDILLDAGRRTRMVRPVSMMESTPSIQSMA